MSQALIIFVKEPVSGKVKTRLGKPPLNLDISCRLYEAFLKDSFDRYSELKNTDIIYFYAGNLESLKKILPNQHIWYLQSNGDLGEKMFNTFSQVLAEYKKCLIVGSDHPDIPISYLKKGLDVLNYVDVSIGKSDDGGYYCIGLKKPTEELFLNMTWSVDTVYSETLRRIESLNLECFELPEWYDIDEYDDLKRFIKSNNINKFKHIKDVLTDIDLK